ncbi:glutamate acetyltransferase [Halotia wernerae UHCC 0503]|nr:glutamate acetyltransferase [Halotia wernerae UHCC 0503]
MHHSLLVSKYTAIKQLIHSQIINAVSIYTYNQKNLYIGNKKIPLYKGRDNSRILYISGIALQVSKSHNQQPMEVANAISSYLSKTCSSVFSIQIVPPGWIHLELSPPFVAAWLESLAMGSLREGGNTKEQKSREESLISNVQIHNPARLFAIQYAHARCCSLVLLAHREELIKLKEPLPDTSPAFWSVIFPERIPWLKCDAKLCLNHPEESRLITELVQVVDDLECNDIGSWEKAGLNLSQAWENFWCKCGIWGEVKTSSPDLAQARLGLLMATQSVLRFLLVEKLGVLAQMEL